MRRLLSSNAASALLMSIGLGSTTSSRVCELLVDSAIIPVNSSSSSISLRSSEGVIAVSFVPEVIGLYLLLPTVVLFGDHETLALEQKGVCGFWRKADANVDDNS